MLNKLKYLFKKVDNNIDKPSIEDFKYEVLFGSEQAKSVYDFKVIKYQLDIYNQGIKREMNMSCGCCGITHVSNAMNICEYNSYGRTYNQLSPELGWLEYLKENPQAQYEGSSLQNWLKWAKNKELISGYSVVWDIESAKNAIDNNRLIYTGSLNGDWVKVKEQKIYGNKEKSYGHLFCIVSYNNLGFIAVNSGGPDNGYFLIPYDLWNTLYTKYVVTDQVDLNVYEKYKHLKERISKMNYLTYYKEYTKVKDKYGINSLELKKVQELGRLYMGFSKLNNN